MVNPNKPSDSQNSSEKQKQKDENQLITAFCRDFISDLTFIEQNDHTLIIIDFDKQLPKGYYLINIVIKGEIITKKLVVE